MNVVEQVLLLVFVFVENVFICFVLMSIIQHIKSWQQAVSSANILIAMALDYHITNFYSNNRHLNTSFLPNKQQKTSYRWLPSFLYFADVSFFMMESTFRHSYAFC